MKDRIGIIGHGVVGDAVSFAFTHKHQVMIYDKNGEYDSFNDLIRLSDYIFICIPIMNDINSNQDGSELNDIISHINDKSEIKKDIIIKSTVLPGTTRYFSDNFPDHNFVFNPEFLRNNTARYDYCNPSRIIIGGENVSGVYQLYNRRFGHIPIHITDWETAELVKYMNNCYYAYKISFLNEFNKIADEFGIDFKELRTLFLSDQEISSGHSDVPGWDLKLGYGGKCLRKDIKAFIKFCELNDMDIESMIACESINDRVRYNRGKKIGGEG